MKDKKEQINEMAKIMQKCYEKNGVLNFKWFAESAYKCLTEDSVILSGKQCVEIVQDNYNIGYKRGSKETAEKIYAAAREVVEKTKYIVDGKPYLHIDALKSIIEQIGAEIKE